ncbi:FitA-like ribbon-helix-helix domain-containing protein [Rhodoplanes serenus]|uniref:FitA-like ribbon-helix-helix domain-containing protein n=1 Tax=Rhodoplanes serenus TaxID=200615 RepID=UPI00131C06B9|nr:hypothetical protein [Rhodoplanes serenus]
MGEIRVPDIDDAVIERLRLKAARNGRSLEQELRALLAAAAPAPPERSEPALTAAQKLDISERLLARGPDLGSFDVSAAIRHGRDDEGVP